MWVYVYVENLLHYIIIIRSIEKTKFPNKKKTHAHCSIEVPFPIDASIDEKWSKNDDNGNTSHNRKTVIGDWEQSHEHNNESNTYT